MHHLFASLLIFFFEKKLSKTQSHLLFSRMFERKSCRMVVYQELPVDESNVKVCSTGFRVDKSKR